VWERIALKSKAGNADAPAGRRKMLQRLRGDDGATMVEYGLMVALIAIVAVFAVQAFGGAVAGLIQSAADMF
jgi:pilus assembly protein Flp/PilA